jgi:hypothetical protein
MAAEQAGRKEEPFEILNLAGSRLQPDYDIVA